MTIISKKKKKSNNNLLNIQIEQIQEELQKDNSLEDDEIEDLTEDFEQRSQNRVLSIQTNKNQTNKNQTNKNQTNKKEKVKLPKQSVIARMFADIQTFRFDKNAFMWFMYDSDYWQIKDEIEIEQILSDKIQILSDGEGFSQSTLNGVLRQFKLLSLWNKWNDSTHLFNFQNGVYDSKKNELRPHDPNDSFTWKLPYNYDENADCPNFQRFLNQVTQNDQDAIELLQAVLAFILRGMTKQQKIIQIVGQGGTGKSTFQTVITDLIGLDNVAVTDLENFETNKYETSNIVGKKLILFNESSSWGGKVSNLKKLSGSDLLRIEEKYKQSTNYKPLGVPLIIGNEELRTNDYTTAITRRMITIPFDYIVPKNKRIFDLSEILRKELSGIFNFAMQLSEQEISQRLQNPKGKAFQEKKLESLLSNDPRAEWAFQNLVYIKDNFISTKDLYEDYVNFRNSSRIEEFRNFGRNFKSLITKLDIVEKVIYTRRRIKQSNQNGYLNLATRDIIDSQHSLFDKSRPLFSISPEYKTEN